MYEYLEGRLVLRRPGRIVLDVGGVGYELVVPLGIDPGGPASDDGAPVRVWTHFQVREDAHKLYGFPDPGLREMFRLLLRVRGVGPGLAITILSALPGDALLVAIAGQDLKALTAIKGVGKKTAEQILLDLRDRAPRPSETDPAVLSPAPRLSPALDDAVRALVSIGYSEKEAEASVVRAAKKVDPKDLELLVRMALQG